MLGNERAGGVRRPHLLREVAPRQPSGVTSRSSVVLSFSYVLVLFCCFGALPERPFFGQRRVNSVISGQWSVVSGEWRVTSLLDTAQWPLISFEGAPVPPCRRSDGPGTSGPDLARHRRTLSITRSARRIFSAQVRDWRLLCHWAWRLNMCSRSLIQEFAFSIAHLGDRAEYRVIPDHADPLHLIEQLPQFLHNLMLP
jgi:hypothetical protein